MMGCLANRVVPGDVVGYERDWLLPRGVAHSSRVGIGTDEGIGNASLSTGTGGWKTVLHWVKIGYSRESRGARKQRHWHINKNIPCIMNSGK